MFFFPLGHARAACPAVPWPVHASAAVRAGVRVRECWIGSHILPTKTGSPVARNVAVLVRLINCCIVPWRIEGVYTSRLLIIVYIYIYISRHQPGTEYISPGIFFCSAGSFNLF